MEEVQSQVQYNELIYHKNIEALLERQVLENGSSFKVKMLSKDKWIKMVIWGTFMLKFCCSQVDEVCIWLVGGTSIPVQF